LLVSELPVSKSKNSKDFPIGAGRYDGAVIESLGLRYTKTIGRIEILQYYVPCHDLGVAVGRRSNINLSKRGDGRKG
jgi:hypothetical protein